MFTSRDAYNTQNIDNLHINIYEMESVTLSERWRAENICSPYTRVYMVTGGEGTIYNEKCELSLIPGNIYIVPAGLKFSYKCEMALEKIFLHISLTLPGTRDIFDGTGDFIVLENKAELIEIFKNNLKSDTAMKVAYIKSSLYGIVAEALSRKSDCKIKNYSPLVLNIIKYIDYNLTESMSANSVAEALFISVGKLRKVFREEVGVAIGKYINERLMHIAEMQIRFTTKSVKEISDSLGFCDQFYFSRCFVQKYGISPKKYRRLIQF